MIVSRPKDIIVLFGGPVRVARALGLPEGDLGAKRVRAWQLRDTIPRNYWHQLIEVAPDAGVTLTLEQVAMAHANSAAT